jgi:hypothetical protein
MSSSMSKRLPSRPISNLEKIPKSNCAKSLSQIPCAFFKTFDRSQLSSFHLIWVQRGGPTLLWHVSSPNHLTQLREWIRVKPSLLVLTRHSSVWSDHMLDQSFVSGGQRSPTAALLFQSNPKSWKPLMNGCLLVKDTFYKIQVFFVRFWDIIVVLIFSKAG